MAQARGTLGIQFSDICSYDPADVLRSTILLEYTYGADSEGEKADVIGRPTTKTDLLLLQNTCLDELAAEYFPSWEDLEKKATIVITTGQSKLMRIEDEHYAAIVEHPAAYLEQEASIRHVLDERMLRGKSLLDAGAYPEALRHYQSLRDFFVDRLRNHYTTLLDEYAARIEAAEQSILDGMQNKIQELGRTTTARIKNCSREEMLSAELFSQSRESAKLCQQMIDMLLKSYGFGQEDVDYLVDVQGAAENIESCLDLLNIARKTILETREGYEKIGAEPKPWKKIERLASLERKLAWNGGCFDKLHQNRSSAIIPILEYFKEETDLFLEKCRQARTPLEQCTSTKTNFQRAVVDKLG